MYPRFPSLPPSVPPSFSPFSTVFLPSYLAIAPNRKCGIQSSRVNLSSVPRSLSNWVTRILCRKSFLLTSTLRNPRCLQHTSSCFHSYYYFLGMFYIVNAHISFSSLPSHSLHFLVWLAFKESTQLFAFPQPTYTCPGCSPVIFKAWLSSDKVSSTHSLSTSAVFLEVNQSILASGTNGNLPERNNYCTKKIY